MTKSYFLLKISPKKFPFLDFFRFLSAILGSPVWLGQMVLTDFKTIPGTDKGNSNLKAADNNISFVKSLKSAKTYIPWMSEISKI